MKYFERILLIVIILMGCWIIYRDYLEEKHMNEFMTELPQLIQDAINNEVFVEYEESETNK